MNCFILTPLFQIVQKATFKHHWVVFTLLHFVTLHVLKCVNVSMKVLFYCQENHLHFPSYCRGSIYLSGPDSCPAVCQMSRMYVPCARTCPAHTHTHTPVCVSKPIHLFPLWSACVRYGDISVAPGSADVAANASGLFFPNHAGSHQTPYCCSYGLVSSRY